jgi:hypothetical protein
MLLSERHLIRDAPLFVVTLRFFRIEASDSAHKEMSIGKFEDSFKEMKGNDESTLLESRAGQQPSFATAVGFRASRNLRGKKAGFGRAIESVISKTSISCAVKCTEPVKRASASTGVTPVSLV